MRKNKIPLKLKKCQCCDGWLCPYCEKPLLFKSYQNERDIYCFCDTYKCKFYLTYAQAKSFFN